MSFNNPTKQRLGDIIDIKHGFAFKGEFFSLTETDDLILSPGNFKIGGGFKVDKFKYYNGKYPKEYILKENDIIVTMTDLSKEGDTLGYSAKIPFSENKRYLHNQRLGLVEFKNDDFDKDYIYWLLRTKDYQSFIVNSATGTTVRHTAPTRIKEYEFLAPNKTTQTKIANILSSIDEKIELNRKTNQTLETLAQTLFKEMCSPKSEELPDGWRIGKLSDVGKIICGKTPSTKNKDYFEGEIPFIKIPNMHNSVFVMKTEEKLTQLGADSQKNKFVPAYSIVVSCIATVGLVSISSELSQTNQQINSIIPANKWECYFLYFKLKTLEKKLKDLGSGGSATLNVNTSTFSGIVIEIPSKDELIKFHHSVEPFFETILSNEKETQTLNILRDSMLPKLMKGEIAI